MKVSASWSPDAITADRLIYGTDLMLPNLKIDGGRLTVKVAIRAKYDDPAHMARVSDHIATIKNLLQRTGSIHVWSVVAGAVAAGTAEEPPEIEISEDQPSAEGAKDSAPDSQQEPGAETTTNQKGGGARGAAKQAASS